MNNILNKTLNACIFKPLSNAWQILKVCVKFTYIYSKNFKRALLQQQRIHYYLIMDNQRSTGGRDSGSRYVVDNNEQPEDINADQRNTNDGDDAGVPDLVDVENIGGDDDAADDSFSDSSSVSGFEEDHDGDDELDMGMDMDDYYEEDNGDVVLPVNNALNADIDNMQDNMHDMLFLEHINEIINMMRDDEQDTLSISSNDFESSKLRTMRLKLYQSYASSKPPITEYAFQPFRLLRCRYKMRCNRKSFPLPRSGHRLIATNSNLYSLGGYNPRHSLSAGSRGRCMLFQELWSFNLATNRWKLELSEDNSFDMPKELASNALTKHGRVLISYGGTGYPFGDKCSNDCYIFRSDENSTVQKLKVTGNLPPPQYGSGIVVHKDYLYVIGGTTGYDYFCDVYRLHLPTNVWENVYNSRPEMREDPEGRYRHEVVYDGTYIYLLGGGTNIKVYDLKRIPAFNLDKNRWEYFETHPDLNMISNNTEIENESENENVFENRNQNENGNDGYPQARKCLSCVQHKLSNGDIEACIVGGLQSEPSKFFKDIWKLNMRTKQWTCIRTAVLPRSLYFHSAAHSDNGCMYIFGGIEHVSTARRVNELYKMWMTVPKLSEMCWDAITYYHENLDTFPRNELLKAGIPRTFLDRLPVGSTTHTEPYSTTYARYSPITVPPKRERYDSSN